MGIRLIRFEENKGIVKCNHIEKDNTINLLKSIQAISSNKININTLGTSGTIKALISKHLSKIEKT
jgi:RNase P/RNase MRP subunit POP5